MSRLVIDMSVEEHQQIKTLAAMRGMTIKEFVLGQIFPLDISAEEEQAWRQLQEVLSNRISQAEKGGIANKSFSQITDEVIKQQN